MDLGIAGKWALVCGASKGLGYGCALSLAREGVNLVINARTPGPLAEAAQRIGDDTGVTVVAVACDITTSSGREEARSSCPQVDILVTNAGGPPPGDFRKFTRDDWIAALDANMLTPIERAALLAIASMAESLRPLPLSTPPSASFSAPPMPPPSGTPDGAPPAAPPVAAPAGPAAARPASFS